MLDQLMSMFSENAEMAQAGINSVNSELAKISEWKSRGYRLTFHFNAKTRELRVEKHEKPPMGFTIPTKKGRKR